MKRLCIADLFCGAGGTSAGAVEAANCLGYRPELTAVNHWPVAIETHSANHPGARHVCTGIDDVNPRDLFKPGELQMLWASPECTHHSVARGGKPINEQSRATAWCVIRWADALQPPVILVENVPEFVTWGGICKDGRPLKAQKGKTFMAWVEALRSLGYRVDWRVLCAADYGDPTTRRRLFVQAVRGSRKIVWPEPTHAPIGEEDLLGRRKPWRAAREIIDWSIAGESIYTRKRPLSDKTMKRIMEGLRKFGLKPFMTPGMGEREGQVPRTHSVEEPVPTVAATGHTHLAEPFLVEVAHGNDGPTGDARRARSLDAPLGTVPCSNRFGIADPFLICMEHQGSVRSVDAPIPTITTAKGGAMAVVQPFILPHEGVHRGNSCRSLDEPLNTVTASHGAGALIQPYLVELRGTNEYQTSHSGKSLNAPLPTVTSGGIHHGLAEPFLVQVNHEGGDRARSVDKPLPTVAGNRGEFALIEPGLLPQQSGGALRSIDEPAPTVATGGAIGLVEPFLVEYYGQGGAESVDAPLNTVTTKDRHALVRPEVIGIDGTRYLLDIRFRMLQPGELALAQGFPRSYRFAGNKTQQVKQIGNAVPRRLARALVLAVLGQNSNIYFSEVEE